MSIDAAVVAGTGPAGAVAALALAWVASALFEAVRDGGDSAAYARSRCAYHMLEP